MPTQAHTHKKADTLKLYSDSLFLYNYCVLLTVEIALKSKMSERQVASKTLISILDIGSHQNTKENCSKLYGAGGFLCRTGR